MVDNTNNQLHVTKIWSPPIPPIWRNVGGTKIERVFENTNFFGGKTLTNEDRKYLDSLEKTPEFNSHYYVVMSDVNLDVSYF